MSVHDPITAQQFEGAAYRGAMRLFEGLVDAYLASDAWLGERYIKSVIGIAMLSVGLDEYKKAGFTLEQAQKKLAESWASPPISGAQEPK